MALNYSTIKFWLLEEGKTRFAKDTVASAVIYDINKNECKEMAPLPFAVSEMATVRWGDNVIVIGGADEQGRTLKYCCYL